MPRPVASRDTPPLTRPSVAWLGQPSAFGVKSSRPQPGRETKGALSVIEGTVYLLHFERPFNGPMRHYLGWTTDLDKRLEDHRRGHGSVTTRRAFEQGIGFELVRTWQGPPSLERKLKAQGAQTNACPRCSRADRRG
jgi:predicted GIY-YIG superfamily endonuclease